MKSYEYSHIMEEIFYEHSGLHISVPTLYPLLYKIYTTTVNGRRLNVVRLQAKQKELHCKKRSVHGTHVVCIYVETNMV